MLLTLLKESKLCNPAEFVQTVAAMLLVYVQSAHVDFIA